MYARFFPDNIILTFKMCLRFELQQYELIDNPKPTTYLGKLFDSGLKGRNRKDSYLAQITELPVKDLLKKILQDYVYYDSRSELGSSLKLRARIHQVLCAYFNISEADIRAIEALDNSIEFTPFSNKYHNAVSKLLRSAAANRGIMLESDLKPHVSSISQVRL